MKFEMKNYEIFENFKGGNKQLEAVMVHDDMNRFMKGKLIPGASVGMHTHETNSEVIYILEGKATCLYDETVEQLQAGDCHYCPKGHSHSLINDSEEDMVYFAVIPEQ